MKILNFKNLAYVGSFLVMAGLSYETYNTINDAKNYKSIWDYQKEIKLKDPKRFNRLINNPISTSPISFNDWRYEAQIMNDSIKYDSLAKKAYFEGAQMVRDSIKNMRIK